MLACQLVPTLGEGSLLFEAANWAAPLENET